MKEAILVDVYVIVVRAFEQIEYRTPFGWLAALGLALIKNSSSKIELKCYEAIVPTDLMHIYYAHVFPLCCRPLFAIPA